jgi:hypothetical protein
VLKQQHLKQPECVHNKFFLTSVSLGKRVKGSGFDDEEAVLFEDWFGTQEFPSAGYLMEQRLDSSVKMSQYLFYSIARRSSILQMHSIHSLNIGNLSNFS